MGQESSLMASCPWVVVTGNVHAGGQKQRGSRIWISGLSLCLMCLMCPCVGLEFNIYQVLDITLLFYESILYLSLILEHCHCEPPSRLQGPGFASSAKEPKIEIRDVWLKLMVAKAQLAKPVQTSMKSELSQLSNPTHLESFGLLVSTWILVTKTFSDLAGFHLTFDSCH